MTDKIEDFINKTLSKSVNNPTINIFDQFVQFCQDYYDQPAHSIAEIKQHKNTKTRGDIFELFSQKYLKHCFHQADFINIWLLSEVPDEVLTKLGLKRNDMGIDLIAVDQQGKYYAIQAKYRKKGYKSVHGINWKTLSTFYGLVERSGPWERYIIITNANYVRHVGKKTKKDLSICYGTLSKIPRADWLTMASLGHKLENSAHLQIEDSIQKPKQKIIIKKKNQNTDELRKKRLAYFT